MLIHSDKKTKKQIKDEALGFISWRRKRRSWSFWRKHIGPCWDVNNISLPKAWFTWKNGTKRSRRVVFWKASFSAFHVELEECMVSWESKSMSFQLLVSQEEITVIDNSLIRILFLVGNHGIGDGTRTSSHDCIRPGGGGCMWWNQRFCSTFAALLGPYNLYLDVPGS